MNDNSRFQPVMVNYKKAMLLARDGGDVAVWEPSSGEFFDFRNAFDDISKWRYQGLDETHDDIIKKLGEVGMDQHYCFIWMNVM